MAKNKAKPDIKPLAEPLGKIVSKAEYARIVGCSPRQVSRMEDAGMPLVKGAGRAGNKIDTGLAIQWAKEQYLEKHAPKNGAGTLDQERLRLLIAQADEKEIDNAQQRGILISSELVSEFAMAAVANMVSALTGMPGRLADQLALEEEPAKCREILSREIERVRAQIATGFEKLSESCRNRDTPGGDNSTATGPDRI